MIILLLTWNVLLTACLVGGLFRMNDMQRQLNSLHIKNLREGLVVQDNEAPRR
jgi:hypothetical protein